MNDSFEITDSREEYLVPTGLRAIIAVQTFEAEVDEAKRTLASTKQEAVDSLDILMNDQHARSESAGIIASAQSSTAFAERMLDRVRVEAAHGTTILGSTVLRLMQFGI